MRLLHLHWPHLPLALMQARASASFPTGPTILGGQPWMPGTVIDASPEARALGVRRGMALGAAHRLAPEAVFLDPEPDADATAIETAFERLAAFSPGVCGTADPHDPAFGLFEVQVDGLGPLWGAEPVLVQRIGGALERLLPGEPRAGIAGTRFAATVAAFHAAPGQPILVPVGDDAAFLASYPAGLLTTDPDVRARLNRFGLRRIGAVAELARSALVARFDAATAERLALGGGDDYELVFTVPPSAERRLETALGGGVRITRIGEIVSGNGVRCLRDGRPVDTGIPGYDHFAG